MFKVNDTNTRKMSMNDVFVVNFEHIYHLFSVSIVDFEQSNVS